MHSFNAKVSASETSGLPPLLICKPSTFINWKRPTKVAPTLSSQMYALMDDSFCALFYVRSQSSTCLHACTRAEQLWCFSSGKVRTVFTEVFKGQQLSLDLHINNFLFIFLL